jgi:hypothetical protein
MGLLSQYCSILLRIIYFLTNITSSPSHVQRILLKLEVSYIALHVSTDIGHHQVFENCWWKLLCFRFVILIFAV